MTRLSANRSRCGSLSAALACSVVLLACSPEPPARPPNPGPTISGTSIRFPGRPEGIRAELPMEAGSTALTIPGRLAWDEDRTVRIHSPFAGRVLKPMAQVGDTVKAGQALAELASSEFGQAVAESRRADTDLKLADDNLARQTELHDAGLVARKELRAAEAERSRADIEAQRARTRLRQVGAAGGPNYTVRAPIAGVVVERAINPGQELRPDQDGAPLFVVTDPTRLWVVLDAPERAMPELAPLPAGTPLRIRSTAWGERDFEGQLLRKDDAIDPELRTFRLRGTVTNADRLLKSGMFVTASFPMPGNTARQAVEHLPQSAVLLMDGKRHVFVQEGDATFTRIEVQVVREQAGRTAVTGLKPGQRVVTEGNLFLQQILSRRGDPGGPSPAQPAAALPPAGRP